MKTSTKPCQVGRVLSALCVCMVWAGCSRTDLASPTSQPVEAGADTAREVSSPDAAVDAAVEAAKEADAEPDYLWKEGDCAHPKVDELCKDGWCRIPAGCFIMGSPEGEYDRALYSEDQVPVTLTHPFYIGQYTVTQKQWTSLGLPNPTVEGPPNGCRGCLEPNCPVTNFTWFEALAFANVAPEKHEPALEPCYQLKGCKGKLGEGMVCDDVALNAATVYECEGFRLPTEAEWEYAARAGTRGANYNGGFAPETTLKQARSCDGERTFDPIAWYCANSSNRMHPVGKKMPNQWGLYDMLGNAAEMMFGAFKHAGYGDSPLTDPWGTFVPKKVRATRGSFCTLWPSALRVAAHDMLPWDYREPGLALRLVHTGDENPGPLAK